MPYYREDSPGRKNNWRHNVAAGLRRSAAARQCPECGRKGALVRHGEYPLAVTVCRYCGYERG